MRIQRGPAAKELFIPVTAGDVWGAFYSYPIMNCYNAGHLARMTFQVPTDFTSIVAAELIVIPAETEAANNWDIYSDYAGTGESAITHSENDTATTYNSVDNQIFAIDLSGILSALAANDFVGIKFVMQDNAHDAKVLGVRFRYA
tara:strand:- start:5135 stop:5569 length:435 start_codon:yes stop_codon:yes gene_type:complete